MALTSAAYEASRLGQANGSGDALALFLKVWGGEVMTTFYNENVMMDKHMVRTINSGKSAQFPVIGTATAEYMTPGDELGGDSIRHNERVISIDGLLTSHVFIANIDEAMNHYDVRAPYSQELGIVLANTFDKNVQIKVAQEASNTTPNITGQTDRVGTSLSVANAKTNGANLASAIYDCAQALDEKNVPSQDRFANLLPAQYYLLAQTTDVINKDWDGAGSYAAGQVYMIAGIPLVKTNQLPSTNITTDGLDNSTYTGNFSSNAGLVYHKSAVGTVKLLDLSMESEYDIKTQGWWNVAKYACGHDGLRPEAACIINQT